jgi:hypothetical protein
MAFPPTAPVLRQEANQLLHHGLELRRQQLVRLQGSAGSIKHK